jgi:hypothetical protein
MKYTIVFCALVLLALASAGTVHAQQAAVVGGQRVDANGGLIAQDLAAATAPDSGDSMKPWEFVATKNSIKMSWIGFAVLFAAFLTIGIGFGCACRRKTVVKREDNTYVRQVDEAYNSFD